MMGGIAQLESPNVLVCLFVLILSNLLFFSLSTCAKFGSNVFQKKLYLKVWRAHFAWRPTQPEKLILNIWFPTSTNNIKFWKKVKYYSSATWFLRERIKQGGQKSTSEEGERAAVRRNDKFVSDAWSQQYFWHFLADIDNTHFTIRRQCWKKTWSQTRVSFVRRLALIALLTTSTALVTAMVMAPLFTYQCIAAAILHFAWAWILNDLSVTVIFIVTAERGICNGLTSNNYHIIISELGG